MNYKMYRKFETIKCNYQQIKSNQIRSKLGSNLEIITKQTLTTYSQVTNKRVRLNKQVNGKNVQKEKDSQIEKQLSEQGQFLSLEKNTKAFSFIRDI